MVEGIKKCPHPDLPHPERWSRDEGRTALIQSTLFLSDDRDWLGAEADARRQAQAHIAIDLDRALHQTLTRQFCVYIYTP